MRTATVTFSTDHMLDIVLLNPCNANTDLRRHSFTFQQDSLSGQTLLSAIHVLVSMAGNVSFCVLLTVEILDF